MADVMKLILVENGERHEEGDITVVTTESLDAGEVTILSGHIPFLSRIKDFLKYTTVTGNVIEKKITNGFIYSNGELCCAVVDKIIS
jgi:F0F1-type ATP synthase epsilon subunit